MEITIILSDFIKIFSYLTELLPSQSNLSSCSSGCRVSFESNRLLISLSNDSLFSQIFNIATEETPPTAKNNTPRKKWSEKKAISFEFVLLKVKKRSTVDCRSLRVIYSLGFLFTVHVGYVVYSKYTFIPLWSGDCFFYNICKYIHAPLKCEHDVQSGCFFSYEPNKISKIMLENIALSSPDFYCIQHVLITTV